MNDTSHTNENTDEQLIIRVSAQAGDCYTFGVFLQNSDSNTTFPAKTAIVTSDIEGVLGRVDEEGMLCAFLPSGEDMIFAELEDVGISNTIWINKGQFHG